MRNGNFYSWNFHTRKQFAKASPWSWWCIIWRSCHVATQEWMFLLMEFSLVLLTPDDGSYFWQENDSYGIGSLNTSLENVYHRMHPKYKSARQHCMYSLMILPKKNEFGLCYYKARMARSGICLKWNCFCRYTISRYFYWL